MRERVVELYTEKFCGIYEIAKRLEVPAWHVRKILEEEGICMRPDGRKYESRHLIELIGRRLEEREGSPLLHVVNSLRSEGYCVDVSGLKKVVPSMSLETFLTLLPVRRRAVKFAENPGGERLFVFEGEASDVPDRFVYGISLQRNVARVRRLYPQEGLVAEGEVSRLKFGSFPENSVYLVDSRFPPALLKRLRGAVLRLSSSVYPTLRMTLYFPHVPGTTRGDFVRELSSLPVGGRSLFFRVRAYPGYCFYLRVLDGDSPSGLIKLFTLSPDAEVALFISRLFVSGKLSAFSLPCRFRSEGEGGGG